MSVAVNIEPARRDDMRALIDMLAEAVPDCSPQTVWSVPWMWARYEVARDPSGTPIAAGALVDVDDNTTELRGLVVHRDHRRRGLASSVLCALLERAHDTGKRMVCVTKRPQFFRKFGFRDTAPGWLVHEPQRLLGTAPPGAPKRVAMAAQSPSQQPSA